MKRRVEKLSFALLALLASACNRDDQNVAARGASATSNALQFVAPSDVAACRRALLEACGKDACAGFEATRRFVLARHEPGCLSGGIGSCGSFRVVEKSSGFDSLQAYFDGTGALRGLSVHNDTSGQCVLGTIPTCSKTFAEKVCP